MNFYTKMAWNAIKKIIYNKTPYVWSNKFTPAKKILHNRWLWWLRHLEGLLLVHNQQSVRIHCMSNIHWSRNPFSIREIHLLWSWEKLVRHLVINPRQEPVIPQPHVWTQAIKHASCHGTSSIFLSDSGASYLFVGLWGFGPSLRSCECCLCSRRAEIQDPPQNRSGPKLIPDDAGVLGAVWKSW